MDSKILFANNARTRITEEVRIGDTVIPVKKEDVGIFPTPSKKDEYFLVRIDNPNTGAFEILKVTSKNETKGTFTVERAQEGTTAKYFPENAIIQNTLTAGSLEKLINHSLATTDEAGIVRLATNEEVKSGIAFGDLPAVCTPEQVHKFGVLAGTVVAFSGKFGGEGNVYPIPEGQTEPDMLWRLCDGEEGTPDLRGRMLLGANDEYPSGSSGGSNSITIDLIEPTTLAVSQMPSHSHPEHLATNTGLGYYSGGWGIVGRDYSHLNTWPAGGNQAHTHKIKATTSSNLPAYYALAYIKKIK